MLILIKMWVIALFTRPDALQPTKSAYARNRFTTEDKGHWSHSFLQWLSGKAMRQTPIAPFMPFSHSVNTEVQQKGCEVQESCVLFSAVNLQVSRVDFCPLSYLPWLSAFPSPSNAFTHNEWSSTQLLLRPNTVHDSSTREKVEELVRVSSRAGTSVNTDEHATVRRFISNSSLLRVLISLLFPFNWFQL